MFEFGGVIHQILSRGSMGLLLPEIGISIPVWSSWGLMLAVWQGVLGFYGRIRCWVLPLAF
jgi:hypothetical protein